MRPDVAFEVPPETLYDLPGREPSESINSRALLMKEDALPDDQPFDQPLPAGRLWEDSKQMSMPGREAIESKNSRALVLREDEVPDDQPLDQPPAARRLWE